MTAAQPARQPLALVVEENAENGCRELLEREGLEVLTAKRRKEGLRVAQEEHPDLVVVDLGLPDGEGKELALEMKLLPQLARVPVIGIRATPVNEKETGRKQEIFDGYLTRPFRREEFRKIVRELLGRRVTREVAARRDRPLKIKS